MNQATVIAIIQAATELTYAGVQVANLIEQARQNGGKLPQSALDQIEREVANANKLWESR